MSSERLGRGRESLSGAWERVRGQPESVLAVGLIGILLVILVPLPSVLIDPLLIINITISLLVLTNAAGVLRPLEFSVFPSLLLMVTFFRLALNIATTRLILGNAAAGPQAAGQVVHIFGSFVGGQNLVVGLVVFSVIVVVQFVVITRGATRVSEVAARFHLDAMPGKQLSIDNDLASGLIDQEKARLRRDQVAKEADFYGAMDGASKFVRGDAIAGLLIMGVNLIGGAAVGVGWHGMSIPEALGVFGRLTIGDGIVSQVPALMVSVASALLVTRSTASGRLGRDLGTQLFANDRLLLIAAVFLLALTPTGLPVVALLGTSLACAVSGWLLRKERLAREGTRGEAALGEAERPSLRIVEAPRLGAPAASPSSSSAEETAKETEQHAVDARALLRVEPLELEIGYRLLPLVAEERGGDLMRRLADIRRRAALELGLVVPSVRVADSRELRPKQYSVRLRGHRLGTWEAAPQGWLAVPRAGDELPSGESAQELDPSSRLRQVVVGGRVARWVSGPDAEAHAEAGDDLLPPAEGLALQIESIVREHSAEILTREEVSRMLRDLKERSPGLVEEAVPEVVRLSDLHRVLQELLREGVSIRDLEAILESLAEQAARGVDAERTLAGVRRALARGICGTCAEGGATLRVVVLEPALEEFLQGSLERTAEGAVLALEPEIVDSVGDRAREALSASRRAGGRPTILCAPTIRPHVWRLARRSVPDVVVLSYEEVLEEMSVEIQGSIRLDRLSQASAVSPDRK